MDERGQTAERCHAVRAALADVVPSGPPKNPGADLAGWDGGAAQEPATEASALARTGSAEVAAAGLAAAAERERRGEAEAVAAAHAKTAEVDALSPRPGPGAPPTLS
jgi:hypothetical protein